MLSKNNKKKIFTNLFGFFIVSCFLFFLAPSLHAQMKLQIPIDRLADISQAEMQQGQGIGIYLAAIYTWFVAAISMLAVVAFMVGGIIWLTAAGSSQRITFAKKIITDTFWALGFVLGSYLFLSTINPKLIQPGSVAIQKIDEVDYLQAEFPEEYRPPSEEPGSGYEPSTPGAPTPAGRKGSAVAYNNMSCPTPATPTFGAYFTTYNKPTYGAPGAYGTFLCNVAMQCTCPKPGRNFSQSCPKGKPEHPCYPFSESTPYCEKDGVIPMRTVAVDTNCFYVNKYGSKSGTKYNNSKTRRGGLQRCRFKIDGIPGEVVGADTGGAIWGRHMDFFVGKNPISMGLTGVHNVTVLNPNDCLIEQTNSNSTPCTEKGNKWCRGH
jgi:3D (Asp-Asp-Asp) domain-containing protein